MEQFSCKTRILCGKGAANALGQMGIRRLFLVTDPLFAGNGAAARIAAAARTEAVEIFHTIPPFPSMQQAAEGTTAVRAFRPDTVAALGGSSAMDCAKAMACFSGMQPKLVTIPTVSGVGAGITGLSDGGSCPDTMILDSSLLNGLPPSQMAEAGFSVLSCALEAYVAAGASAITDALARDAFTAAFAALPAAFAGSAAAGQRIHTAAAMAAMAFTQAGLGLCHAMTRVLSQLFPVSVGQLSAIVLPAVVGCNAHATAEKYARLARSADLGGCADNVAVRNLKNALIRLRHELDLPATLAQVGVNPRQIWHHAGQIATAVLKDPCCRANPIAPEDFMVRRILEATAGRI